MINTSELPPILTGALAVLEGVITGKRGALPNEAEAALQYVKNALAAPRSETMAPAASKYHLPPKDANGKRPRLFYYEEAEDAWCPAEGLEVDNILGVDLFLADGEVIEIEFKRQDMTDEEFDAIPEG